MSIRLGYNGRQTPTLQKTYEEKKRGIEDYERETYNGVLKEKKRAGTERD